MLFGLMLCLRLVFLRRGKEKKTHTFGVFFLPKVWKLYIYILFCRMFNSFPLHTLGRTICKNFLSSMLILVTLCLVMFPHNNPCNTRMGGKLRVRFRLLVRFLPVLFFIGGKKWLIVSVIDVGANNSTIPHG